MKPRSSTEIFASSSGRKRPLRYTVMSASQASWRWSARRAHRFSRADSPDASFEPQSDGVPRTPEQARERHLLQANQRVLSDRLGVERDLAQADTLSARDRRNQRLDGLQRELQLRRLALGQRHVLVNDEAGGDRVRRALPYLERADLRAVLIELHGVVELEYVNEQLLGLARARRIGPRAEHHGKQPPRATLRRRDQTIARTVGKSGLDAVDVRVAPEQPVAIRLRDVVVAVLLDRIKRVILREIPDDGRGDQRGVGRSRT